MQVQGDLGSVVHSWAAISEGTALPKGRGRSPGLHLGIPASNTEGREIRLVIVETRTSEVGLHEDTEDH